MPLPKQNKLARRDPTGLTSNYLPQNMDSSDDDEHRHQPRPPPSHPDGEASNQSVGLGDLSHSTAISESATSSGYIPNAQVPPAVDPLTQSLLSNISGVSSTQHPVTNTDVPTSADQSQQLGTARVSLLDTRKSGTTTANLSDEPAAALINNNTSNNAVTAQQVGTPIPTTTTATLNAVGHPTYGQFPPTTTPPPAPLPDLTTSGSSSHVNPVTTQPGSAPDLTNKAPSLPNLSQTGPQQLNLTPPSGASPNPISSAPPSAIPTYATMVATTTLPPVSTTQPTPLSTWQPPSTAPGTSGQTSAFNNNMIQNPVPSNPVPTTIVPTSLAPVNTPQSAVSATTGGVIQAAPQGVSQNPNHAITGNLLGGIQTGITGPMVGPTPAVMQLGGLNPPTVLNQTPYVPPGHQSVNVTQVCQSSTLTGVPGGAIMATQMNTNPPYQVGTTPPPQQAGLMQNAPHQLQAGPLPTIAPLQPLGPTPIPMPPPYQAGPTPMPPPYQAGPTMTPPPPQAGPTMTPPPPQAGPTTMPPPPQAGPTPSLPFNPTLPQVPNAMSTSLSASGGSPAPPGQSQDAMMQMMAMLMQQQQQAQAAQQQQQQAQAARDDAQRQAQAAREDAQQRAQAAQQQQQQQLMMTMMQQQQQAQAAQQQQLMAVLAQQNEQAQATNAANLTQIAAAQTPTIITRNEDKEKLPTFDGTKDFMDFKRRFVASVGNDLELTDERKLQKLRQKLMGKANDWLIVTEEDNPGMTYDEVMDEMCKRYQPQLNTLQHLAHLETIPNPGTTLQFRDDLMAYYSKYIRHSDEVTGSLKQKTLKDAFVLGLHPAIQTRLGAPKRRTLDELVEDAVDLEVLHKKEINSETTTKTSKPEKGKRDEQNKPWCDYHKAFGHATATCYKYAEELIRQAALGQPQPMLAIAPPPQIPTHAAKVTPQPAPVPATPVTTPPAPTTTQPARTRKPRRQFVKYDPCYHCGRDNHPEEQCHDLPENKASKDAAHAKRMARDAVKLQENNAISATTSAVKISTLPEASPPQVENNAISIQQQCGALETTTAPRKNDDQSQQLGTARVSLLDTRKPGTTTANLLDEPAADLIQPNNTMTPTTSDSTKPKAARHQFAKYDPCCHCGKDNHPPELCDILPELILKSIFLSCRDKNEPDTSPKEVSAQETNTQPEDPVPQHQVPEAAYEEEVHADEDEDSSDDDDSNSSDSDQDIEYEMEAPSLYELSLYELDEEAPPPDEVERHAGYFALQPPWQPQTIIDGQDDDERLATLKHLMIHQQHEGDTPPEHSAKSGGTPQTAPPEHSAKSGGTPQTAPPENFAKSEETPSTKPSPPTPSGNGTHPAKSGGTPQTAPPEHSAKSGGTPQTAPPEHFAKSGGTPSTASPTATNTKSTKRQKEVSALETNTQPEDPVPQHQVPEAAYEEKRRQRRQEIEKRARQAAAGTLPREVSAVEIHRPTSDPVAESQVPETAYEEKRRQRRQEIEKRARQAAAGTLPREVSAVEIHRPTSDPVAESQVPEAAYEEKRRQRRQEIEKRARQAAAGTLPREVSAVEIHRPTSDPVAESQVPEVSHEERQADETTNDTSVIIHQDTSGDSARESDATPASESRSQNPETSRASLLDAQGLETPQVNLSADRKSGTARVNLSGGHELGAAQTGLSDNRVSGATQASLSADRKSGTARANLSDDRDSGKARTSVSGHRAAAGMGKLTEENNAIAATSQSQSKRNLPYAEKVNNRAIGTTEYDPRQEVRKKQPSGQGVHPEMTNSASSAWSHDVRRRQIAQLEAETREQQLYFAEAADYDSPKRSQRAIDNDDENNLPALRRQQRIFYSNPNKQRVYIDEVARQQQKLNVERIVQNAQKRMNEAASASVGGWKPAISGPAGVKIPLLPLNPLPPEDVRAKRLEGVEIPLPSLNSTPRDASQQWTVPEHRKRRAKEPPRRIDVDEDPAYRLTLEPKSVEEFSLPQPPRTARSYVIQHQRLDYNDGSPTMNRRADDYGHNSASRRHGNDQRAPNRNDDRRDSTSYRGSGSGR